MSRTKNIVFIARSLDGYIAGPNGELDWLHATPNPDGIDMGFGALVEEVDAIVMGRGTIEVVCGFEGPWPYSKPIYVLSNTLPILLGGGTPLFGALPKPMQWEHIRSEVFLGQLVQNHYSRVR